MCSVLIVSNIILSLLISVPIKISPLRFRYNSLIWIIRRFLFLLFKFKSSLYFHFKRSKCLKRRHSFQHEIRCLKMRAIVRWEIKKKKRSKCVQSSRKARRVSRDRYFCNVIIHLCYKKTDNSIAIKKMKRRNEIYN